MDFEVLYVEVVELVKDIRDFGIDAYIEETESKLEFGFNKDGVKYSFSVPYGHEENTSIFMAFVYTIYAQTGLDLTMQYLEKYPSKG